MSEVKEFWLWDYLAEKRWHRSTVYIDETGHSTDGNYYPVIHLAKIKKKYTEFPLMIRMDTFEEHI